MWILQQEVSTEYAGIVYREIKAREDFVAWLESTITDIFENAREDYLHKYDGVLTDVETELKVKVLEALK